MRYLRPLPLALTTLMLLAACSQPEDGPPGLEPQFGTSGFDAVTAVSFAPKGIVTKAIRFTRGAGETLNDYRTELQIRQLDPSARLLRQVSLGVFPVGYTNAQAPKFGR